MQYKSCLITWNFKKQAVAKEWKLEAKLRIVNEQKYNLLSLRLVYIHNRSQGEWQ